MMHRPSNDAEAAGPIYVIWDIKMCPVLNEYYARRVGPCVRWYMRKLGYSGDISITVVGQLSKVPEDILEAVSSTGISLHNSFRDSIGVELLLCTCPRRSNILLLATPRSFSYFTDSLKEKGRNIISPFPNNSNEADVKYLWKIILSGPEGDNKCSETVEPASWNCGVCVDFVGKGFENFMTHLSSQKHKRELQLWYPPGQGYEDEDKAVEANVDFPLVNISGGGLNLNQRIGVTDSSALAAISVFWDILKCPVPYGYDARRVGLSIRRFLRNLGYSGPITITAVGELSKVPEKILEAVSSTGISLYNSLYGSRDIVLLLLDCFIDNPPPANIMVISLPPNFSNIIHYLRKKGCNLVLPLPLDSSIADAKYLWVNFLMAGELEDDKCSETGEPASWVCTVCNEFAGQGFENFITHLSTQEHKQGLPFWFPPIGDVCLDEDEEPEKAKMVVEANDVPEKANKEEKVVDAPLENISGGGLNQRIGAIDSSALAEISVFWDILNCQVPRGCDARRVGPCIIWYLRNLGYSGRISITAFGELSYIPVRIREAVSSTGISLLNCYRGSTDLVPLLFASACQRESVVVITTTSRKFFNNLSDYLPKDGCKVINMFPGYYNQGYDVMRLWRKILSDPEGVKCSETVEANEDEKTVEANVYFPLENATTMGY